MGYGGGFHNWQFGQVGAMLTASFCLYLVFRLCAKVKGQRLKSKTSLFLGLLIAATIGLAGVYLVDSQPHWDARARLNESFDLIAEETNLEVVDANRYGRISVSNSRRPRDWPPNCVDKRLHGSGIITFTKPLTPQHFENVALRLEQDGFSVHRQQFSNGQPALIGAVGGDQSVNFSLDLAATKVLTTVDEFCEEDLVRWSADCPLCVDSFVD